MIEHSCYFVKKGLAGSIAQNFGAILADGGPTSTAQNVLSTCLKLRYESPLRQDQVQCPISVTETKGTQTSELYPRCGLGLTASALCAMIGPGGQVDIPHTQKPGAVVSHRK